MLMTELRSKTATLHQQTENALNLTHSCESKQNYITLLRTMLSLYRPIESSMDRIDWKEANIDWKTRRKSALIEQDLIALGSKSTVENEDAVQNIPLHSTAAAIGCLYVLEGSTLGAQFIMKHIERTLKLTPRTGAAFFNGYGAATREKWAAFASSADAFAGEDPHRIAEAIDAACWTFAAFESALRESKSANASVKQPSIVA